MKLPQRLPQPDREIMNAERPLNELTQDAIRVLHREPGVLATVRFLWKSTDGFVLLFVSAI